MSETNQIVQRLTFREEGDNVNVYLDGVNGQQFVASAHAGLFVEQGQYEEWQGLISDLYRSYLERQGCCVTSIVETAAEPQGSC